MSTARRKAPKSRAESKLATREALIAAGMTEISKHGLDASLDAICARAKLTRGAFYVHFADRDAFLLAVMHHVLGRFVTSLTGLDAPDLASALHTFAGAVGSPALHPAARAAGALRFHHVMEACRRSKPIGDGYRGLMMHGRDAIAALIARDQAAGRTRAKPAARGIADLLVVFALGVTALLELEIPIELPGLERAMLELLTPAARD